MATGGTARTLAGFARRFHNIVYTVRPKFTTNQPVINIASFRSIRNGCVTQVFRGIASQTRRQISSEKQTACSWSKRWAGAGLFPVALGFSLFGVRTEEQKEYDAAVEKLKKDDKVVLMLKHAKLAETKQEFEDAEKYYHKALNVLQVYEQRKTWSAEDILGARVYIHDHMANLALYRGKLPLAETLFKETMRGLLQKGRAKDDNAVIEISLKLAMIYAIQGRHEEAELGYHYCMEQQEKKLLASEENDENSLALLGLCVDSYSRVLLGQKKYTQAQANLEKAVGIARKVFGNNHPQVAVLLNNLATVASLQLNYDAAKSHLHAAVEVAKDTAPEDLSTYQCNLGLVCMQMKEFEEARGHCRAARRTAKDCKDKVAKERAAACLESLKEKT